MPDAAAALAEAIVEVACELRGRAGRTDLVLISDGRIEAALQAGAGPGCSMHVVLCRIADALGTPVVHGWQAVATIANAVDAGGADPVRSIARAELSALTDSRGSAS